MDSLIMAGGKGTRLNLNIEKPLLEINGIRIIDDMIKNLLNSEIENIYIAVSPNTPETKKHILENLESYSKYLEDSKTTSDAKIFIIETSGKDYVNDLGECIPYFKSSFLTLSGDLVNVKSKTINTIIRYYSNICKKNNDIEALCVVTPIEDYPATPTINFEGYVPLGINIVSPNEKYQKEELFVLKEPILNVNTIEDLTIVIEDNL
ncbi:adenosylcobinamide-phosphate guanylyltransferase [Methanococcus voltae]|uniref:Adenosylcobinamide-phosphate guanylyltransferase n=1 Tax=Methanococcus voltae TaxID=2188 RepID=A0A8J7RHH4_METVO|nr:adenosylcobinamide-phosphate guanylyltransferase [Methanococcus voltae]MBP2172048.1 adenosylcobinamide-phosphate guanylyltransferase [Methanococcus voltae]MBP2200996.1 adenosylcobinamide-phosphate guanylyltransferase [Methanococcus voltae]